MPVNATSYNEPFDEEQRNSSVSDKVSETASQVKSKVSDMGRTAADKIDENRAGAASGLDRAASTLHEKADNLPGGEKVTSIAHAAADKLNTAADYVREHDVKRMMGDVEAVVKNNPGPSLLVAALFGFLVARAFSNND